MKFEKKYARARRLASLAYIHRGLTPEEIEKTPIAEIKQRLAAQLVGMDLKLINLFYWKGKIRDDGAWKEITPCGFDAEDVDGNYYRVYCGTKNIKELFLTDLDNGRVKMPWAGHAHDGFEDYRRAVDNGLGPLPEGKRSYSFIGHSLGGAAAFLSYCRHFFSLAESVALECWTFGEPASLDLEAAKSLPLRLRAAHWRWRFGQDIVSRIGLEPGDEAIPNYLHHANTYYQIDYSGRNTGPRGRLGFWAAAARRAIHPLSQGVRDHGIDDLPGYASLG